MAAGQPIDQIGGGHEPVAATCPEDDKRTSKFEDPTPHLRFSFSSRCRRSMAAASAHLRVQLKNVAKQSAVDPATAIFTESVLILSWKRPVATKAAHAWFYRALTGVNWKDGDGTWLVLPYLGGDVPSSVVELASGSLRGAANRAATSLAPITAATSLTSVFPTSPALKLLRVGIRVSRRRPGTFFMRSWVADRSEQFLRLRSATSRLRSRGSMPTHWGSARSMLPRLLCPVWVAAASARRKDATACHPSQVCACWWCRCRGCGCGAGVMVHLLRAGAWCSRQGAWFQYCVKYEQLPDLRSCVLRFCVRQIFSNWFPRAVSGVER